MTIQQHLLKMKKIQAAVLKYIDSEYNESSLFSNLKKLFQKPNIEKNAIELKEVLHIISDISNYHPRKPGFFNKIFQILNELKSGIKSNFSERSIFTIFKQNKRIILFLIEEKFIKIEKFAGFIKENSDYLKYFAPEIKPFIKIHEQLPEDFEERRRTGENDDLLCKMIREDMLDDFISFVKENKIKLSSKTYKSIYETNSFLIDKNPTLIEYAVFSGSVGIFNYLHENKVELKPELWHFAIHSNNIDMIYLLEECQVEPIEDDYEKYIEESISCHNTDIMNYFTTNLFPRKQKIAQQMLQYGLKYHNYSFIIKDFLDESVFHELCQYDYIYFVISILKTKEIDINNKKIQNFIFQ